MSKSDTPAPAATPAPAETDAQKDKDKTAQDEKTAQQQSAGSTGNLLMDFFMMLFKAIMGSFTDPDSEYSEIDKENAAAPTTARGASAGKAFLDSVGRDNLKKLADKYPTLPADISPFTVDAKITSILGKRDIALAGASHDHQGIDIVPVDNSAEAITIHNTMPGVVVRSETQLDKNGKVAGFGNWVEVACIDGTRRRYGHLKQLGAPVGTVLDQGDIVGVMGSTGTSEAAHLHYEWRNENGISLEPTINGKTYARNDHTYKGSTVTASHVTPGAAKPAEVAKETPPAATTPPSPEVAAKVASLGLTDKLKVADAALGNLPSLAMNAFSTVIGAAPTKS